MSLGISAPAQTRIAHISDIHLGASSAPNARPRLLAIVESLNEKRPDVVFVTGDIAENPSSWIEVRQILAGVSSPLHYVPGNHDTNGPNIATYRSVFGEDYYKLELANVTVFALNSQLLGNFNDLHADTPPPMDPVAQAEGEKMLQWLAQQTATPGKVAIAIQHVPLFFSERLPERRPYWVISEPFRSRELTELRRLNVRHVLAGHWHMRDVEDEQVIQHIAPSVAWPLFKSQPGYTLHTISARGALTTKHIAPATDLSVKVTSPDSVGLGDTVTYTVTVKNNGPLTASGVLLTDDLPGGQRFISASTSQGTCSGSSPVVCALGSLAAQGQAKLSIAIEARQHGTMTNSVTVAANQYDFKQGNNSARASTNVQNRDFELRISPASATVKAGGSATYTVTVVPTSAGFRNQISFSCPGLVAGATCRFDPAQVVPGNQQRTSALTVTVPASFQSAHSAATPNSWVAVFLVLACAGAGLSGSCKRSSRILLALMFLVVLGCGGGAEDTKRSTDKADSITVTVSGSAGSLQRKATAMLIVQ
ncbi:MAG: metallophosphoesterase [Acidobacteriales bacterium]|nr:metallophosphoesterase [Terriglobales bacterium]